MDLDDFKSLISNQNLSFQTAKSCNSHIEKFRHNLWRLWSRLEAIKHYRKSFYLKIVSFRILKSWWKAWNFTKLKQYLKMKNGRNLGNYGNHQHNWLQFILMVNFSWSEKIFREFSISLRWKMRTFTADVKVNHDSWSMTHIQRYRSLRIQKRNDRFYKKCSFLSTITVQWSFTTFSCR